MLKVLEYHHLPAEIKTLIIDCYDNYAISVATGDYSNEPMYLRPLLFNMIVKTLKKSTDHEKILCVGYSSAKTLLLRHWFQFADHSAINCS